MKKKNKRMLMMAMGIGAGMGAFMWMKKKNPDMMKDFKKASDNMLSKLEDM